MRTVIYWKTDDRERKKEVMDELGIRGTSINGESEYHGPEERLEKYKNEGLFKVRKKNGQ